MTVTLEQRLEQIKKIKFLHGGPRYVGTQEALNYIRGMEQVEKRPREIADAINAKLKEPQYQATQERVAALVSFFYDIDEPLKEKGIRLSEPYFENAFYSIDYKTDTIKTTINSDLVKLLAQAFGEANRNGVRDDASMQEFLVQKYLPEVARKQRRKMPDLNGYVEKGSLNATPKFFEEQKQIAYDILTRTLLDKIKIVKRMVKDRVELQQEQKQEMVDTYLREGGFEMLARAEVTDTAEAYSMMTEWVTRNIQRRKERLERANRERMPKPIILREEDLVNQATMLRQALGREKTYIMKRLEQYLTH